MTGDKAKWLLVALIYLAALEVVSYWPASAPCLIDPNQHAHSGQDNHKQACPTLFQGSLILLGRADHFIESHDKSIVAIFTVVLALSTILLWRSTDKLWQAGERQMTLLARNTIQQRQIGEAQVRAYVSIKSAAIYFGGEGEDGPVPFIEIVAVNSGQSPALAFIWAPELRYFADVQADIVSDPGDEWMQQPGQDISPTSELKQMYFPTDFPLFGKIIEHRADIPEKVGISIIVHFAWADVFGNQISDMASFAGVAESLPGNERYHPVNTSTWACLSLHPIEKGSVWAGIAFQAPAEAKKPEADQPDKS